MLRDIMDTSGANWFMVLGALGLNYILFKTTEIFGLYLLSQEQLFNYYELLITLSAFLAGLLAGFITAKFAPDQPFKYAVWGIPGILVPFLYRALQSRSLLPVILGLVGAMGTFNGGVLGTGRPPKHAD
ncbi:MAG: hypothetical protein ACP5G7_07505 [Anaerolineae bacterium]